MELLQLCWLVTDGICSKRLAPFLPELLDRLRRRQALRQFPIAVQARVARMSASTVDRALKSERERSKPADVSQLIAVFVRLHHIKVRRAWRW